MTPVQSHVALTTVMYHYVRPMAGSAFPRLAALDLAAFLGQLDHLRAQYDVISPQTFLQALQRDAVLPPRACLLTFDDGYADHNRHVFPHPMPQTLADEVDALLRSEGMIDPAPLRAAHFTPNRFDGPEIAYVKRLLQHALPADVRTRLAAQLFARHVTADLTGLAEDLYLTTAQAREMLGAGMGFGGHGDRHLWHGLASPQDLAAEVAGSVAALTAIGAPVEGACYCYPDGSQTGAVRASVAAAGFGAGFTVVPDLWSPGADRFQIAQIDTNDLPHRPMPNDPWAAQAAGGRMTSGAGA